MPRNEPQHARSAAAPVWGLLAFLSALALAPAAKPAYAAGSESAVAQVQALTSALLGAMRAGPAESVTERYRRLDPVVEQVFALPFMARLSVGPGWQNFSLRQQAAVIAAFSRYTVANYAHNFRSFSGQRFQIDGNVITRGEDKVVRTSLTSPGATPTMLLYRMREVGGQWKVVDVYYDGVSQLALHRVQFASAIAAGGAPVLIAYLNKVSDRLLR